MPSFKGASHDVACVAIEIFNPNGIFVSRVWIEIIFWFLKIIVTLTHIIEHREGQNYNIPTLAELKVRLQIHLLFLSNVTCEEEKIVPEQVFGPNTSAVVVNFHDTL